jgi:hypothetical protein
LIEEELIFLPGAEEDRQEGAAGEGQGGDR